MKRILTFVALIGMVVAAYAQQRALVTLSHNGELSFFTHNSALENALDSAVNGDIIYLSEGDFTSNSSSITIKKRVSIVGCGFKSRILADLTIDMRDNPDSYMDAPLFDGVRMQELIFYNGVGDDASINRNNLKEVTISKSWIRELENGGIAGNNFNVDRCYIEHADFDDADNNNTFVQNSKIGAIKSYNYGEVNIQVKNCNIGSTYGCPRVVISSIIGGTDYDGHSGAFLISGKHIIYNSLFPSKALVDRTEITAYNCYFDAQEGGVLNENLEATMDLKEKGYLGEDGTVIGIYGGDFPFSETPSVPTVDSSKSSVTYDAENNKLNVTITVSPSN